MNADESAQIERIKILTSQINYAAKKYENIMILGDANLDMNKWNEPKYKNAIVTQVLRDCLDSNGLIIENIGDTYIANHIQKNGNISTSAIDHIYHRIEKAGKITVKKITNCSSDHLPVIATIPIPKSKMTYIRKIMKRSYKNFTQEIWTKELKKKDWTKVENEGVKNLSKLAPFAGGP